MERDQAKLIIRSLADGRDPSTGEQFPPNSLYQQADTVRALYVALEAPEKPAKTAKPTQRQVDPNKPKVGANWTPDEEEQLRTAFAAHKPIPEIATAHGRTQGAITARLVKLGLIEDTATNRAGHGNRPSVSPGRPMPPPRPLTPPRELTQAEKDDLPF